MGANDKYSLPVISPSPFWGNSLVNARVPDSSQQYNPYSLQGNQIILPDQANSSFLSEFSPTNLSSTFKGLEGLDLPGASKPPATGGFKWGMNKGTFDAVGNIGSGLGALAQGWASIKGLGLAEDALKQKREFANVNLFNQGLTINNRYRDQNAWKKAQGRTDFATLIPNQRV